MTNIKRFSFPIDQETEQILDQLNEYTKLSRAELIRRGILLTRVIMDPSFKLQDIVSEKNWKKSLPEIIIPIPILKGKLL